MLVSSPDRMRNDHCIGVTVSGRPATAMPVTLYNAQYKRADTTDWREQLHEGFILVQRTNDGKTRPLPGFSDGRLLYPDQIGGLRKKTGRNAPEKLHPQEIMAANFSLLVTDRHRAKSPEKLVRLERNLMQEKEQVTQLMFR